MTTILAVARLVPVSLGRRLLVAALEIALAGVVLSGSVILGHELREWREWYGDPGTAHPWAPTRAPSPAPSAAPVEVRAP